MASMGIDIPVDAARSLEGAGRLGEEATEGFL